MVDNYYQTSYDIEDDTSKRMIKRFVEQTNDDSLSAVHIRSGEKKKNNEWMPANGPISFYNNGLGNRHFVKIQLSAFTGAIYEEETELEFLINKKDIVFSPNITEYGGNSATLTTVIYPTQSDDFGFKWAAYPPENVLFHNLDNDPISPNVFYNDLTDYTSGYICIKKSTLDKYILKGYYGDYFLSLLIYCKKKKIRLKQCAAQ
jgi:hypothetical protein